MTRHSRHASRGATFLRDAEPSTGTTGDGRAPHSTAGRGQPVRTGRPAYDAARFGLEGRDEHQHRPSDEPARRRAGRHGIEGRRVRRLSSRAVRLRARDLPPPRADPATRVLDVGLSPLTMELLQRYASVTSLGFPLEPWSVTETTLPDGSHRALAGHVPYDFNAAQTSTPIPTDARFDLIVFAEVIEHLYTAPELTLFALKQVMAPNGLLILQTPNAAALHKRLALLAGRNPYERIRINPQNRATSASTPRPSWSGSRRASTSRLSATRFATISVGPTTRSRSCSSRRSSPSRRLSRAARRSCCESAPETCIPTSGRERRAPDARLESPCRIRAPRRASMPISPPRWRTTRASHRSRRRCRRSPAPPPRSPS